MPISYKICIGNNNLQQILLMTLVKLRNLNIVLRDSSILDLPAEDTNMNLEETSTQHEERCKSKINFYNNNNNNNRYLYSTHVLCSRRFTIIDLSI